MGSNMEKVTIARKSWGVVAALFLLAGLVLMASPSSAQDDPYTDASPSPGATIEGGGFERSGQEEAEAKGNTFEREFPVTGLDALQIAGIAVLLIASGMVLVRRRRSRDKRARSEAI
jgi:hypothetical protein